MFGDIIVSMSVILKLRDLAEFDEDDRYVARNSFRYCYEAGCQVVKVNRSGKSRTNLLFVLGAPDKGMRSRGDAAIYRRGSEPACNGTRSAPLAGPHCLRTDDSPRDTPFGLLITE
jgi:hypothetical protein